MLRDPLGDLRGARDLDVPDARVLGHGVGPATREALREELGRGARQLTVCAHVRPGDDDDPASSAFVLRAPGPPELGRSAEDHVTVAELTDLGIPAVCVLLVCDGAGAATGAEWTGVATGLVWAGARWVVTSTTPVIQDDRTAASDARLLAAIASAGPLEVLWAWQRGELASRRAAPGDGGVAPYRWAATIVNGPGSRAEARRWARQGKDGRRE